jgi:hypothetical protein
MSAGVPWTAGEDLSRSLWDSANLIVFLELDYQNLDRPDEPFRYPADVLLHMEPAFRATRALLDRFGIGARTFVSGRGYHFVGRIPLDCPLVDVLADLVPGPPGWWSTQDRRRPAGVTHSISRRHARAADGLGLLLEHAAQLVLRRARRLSAIPVLLNGTSVGSGLNGRASVSIDFSHAGDPLDARHMRAAFSTYQWHRYRPDIFGADVAASVAPLAVVPRRGRSILGLLSGGRSLGAAREAARTTHATLPDVSAGMSGLADHYRASRLAAFHRRYYAARAGLASNPPDLRVPPAPGCVGASLTEPNDRLLKPEHVQHLVRVLMARGWDAARIAALVQSLYEEDHDWGDRWTRLDAGTRAAFDVRVFAGLVETGVDALIDFNCVSAQEKDLCPRTGCPYDLRRDRDVLASRRAS